jgi:hypothetical protein
MKHPLSTISPSEPVVSSLLPQAALLNHFFKLRAENVYSSIGVKITAECYVEPVALLTFDDKVTPRKIWGIWFIFSSLSDNVD